MANVDVDDFIHVGSKLFKEHVLNKLLEVFEIDKTAEALSI